MLRVALTASGPTGGRPRPRRRLRLVALLAAALWAGGALAQCVIPPESLSFDIAGVGTAYFRDLSTDRRNDLAVFSGGVCVSNPAGGWTILADGLTIKGLSGDLELVIDAPSVLLPEWVIRADTLVSRGRDLVLSSATFVGGRFSGVAERLVIDPLTGRVQISNVVVSGNDFIIRGEAARLEGSVVTIDDAVASTCLCDRPVYQVRSARAELDLEQQRIVIRRGVLESGPARLALADTLVLSPEGIANLSAPITVEYVSDDPDSGKTGTGLGVGLPVLKVADSLDLETGFTGLDLDHAFGGFGLLRYRGSGVSFTLGQAREGLRFEVSLEQALAPWLEFGFEVANRHEPDIDYLHQGLLRLSAEAPTVRPGWGRLDGRVTAFAAASAQALPGGPIAGARLGVAATLDARSPRGDLGQARVLVDLEASHYPDHGSSQVGVRLRPSYTVQRNPVEARLALDRQWVVGGSPFTANLDRLEPRARLAGSVRLAGRVARDLDGTLVLASSYRLLAEDETPAGLQALTLTGRLEYHGPLEVNGRLALELAGLLDDRGDEPEAAVEFDVDVGLGPSTFGVRFRYDLLAEEAGLDRLETRLDFPIVADDVTVRPYLALDFGPSFLAGQLPLLSGHGLELAVRTCCGTVVLGYRQQSNVFSTTLALRFED